MERVQLGRFLMKTLVFAGEEYLSRREMERALDEVITIQLAMNYRIISPDEAWVQVSRALDFLKFTLN